jgi:hypothetical protein
LPKAIRVAVLVNPADATSTASTVRDVREAADLNASTSREIDAAE